ncbi:hypothetical protein LJC64_01890 [Ruminococcaceae bacterium OttesenSCG-928-A11]|nr:hypothetical protein [Ruminococcaceae bacterium OttesenSCG-928-A11]
MVHLVYCDNKENELGIILSGEKTMVVRGAAGKKIPHSRVEVGETLFFMEKGSGKISAMATVDSVENHAKLTDTEIKSALEQNQPRLQLSANQKAKWHKKCLVFVGFKDARAIEPLAYDHSGGMDDWLILDSIEDVVKNT